VVLGGSWWGGGGSVIDSVQGGEVAVVVARW